jgi:hypothetical protein
VWGQNDLTREGKTESVLLETNYQRGRDTFYGRFERVEKSGHELALAARDYLRVFPIYAYTIGYVRDLPHGNGIDSGVGGQVTINSMPDYLARYYDGNVPATFEIFARLRPSLHPH